MTKNSLALTVTSHPKYLSVIRLVTSTMARLHEVADEDANDIVQGVDEACSNVIKYAYLGDTTKKISLQLKVSKELFEVVIEDSGAKADPQKCKGRSLDDLRAGGLGAHFIQKAFHIVSFDEKKKKGNRLILIRHLREKPIADEPAVKGPAMKEPAIKEKNEH